MQAFLRALAVRLSWIDTGPPPLDARMPPAPHDGWHASLRTGLRRLPDAGPGRVLTVPPLISRDRDNPPAGGVAAGLVAYGAEAASATRRLGLGGLMVPGDLNRSSMWSGEPADEVDSGVLSWNNHPPFARESGRGAPLNAIRGHWCSIRPARWRVVGAEPFQRVRAQSRPLNMAPGGFGICSAAATVMICRYGSCSASGVEDRDACTADLMPYRQGSNREWGAGDLMLDGA